MSFPNQKVPCLYFVTLGCAKNEVDTRDMKRAVSNAGYHIASDPEDAQAIIVNTCSFIQSATEESLETIFDMVDIEAVKQGRAKLIVTGCMSSRYGKELETELNEVDLFIPCAEEENIVSALNELFGLPNEGESPSSDQPEEDVCPSSYVKISEGCDRWCSYCTIPSIRGPYHSYSLRQIVEDIADKVTDGVKEIVLIAQDTGRWGQDLDKPLELSDLLEALVEAFPETWFRIMYLQPEGLTDKLLKTISAHDTICNYIDIPLQHCVEKVLTDMNRNGSLDVYLKVIDHIRNSIPDCTIRTTLITGFPGETEKDFKELCRFVEEASFDYVGVFPYSQEEGTRAAKMPSQVEEQVKMERAQIIRDLADAISTEKIAKKIGTQQNVLIVGYEDDGQLYGRTQGQAPDVDGVVYLNKGVVGSIVETVIEDTFLYDMEAV